MTVLVFLDGVLRRRGEDKSPIVEGTAIFKAMSMFTRVVVIADDAQDADRWFKSNGLSQKVDDIIDYKPPVLENVPYKQVQHVRSKGRVDIVITDDIELSKELLESGVASYLFLHPKYIRPEFRPDGRGRKSWDEVTEELDKQQGLFTEDPRV